ncbi:MAG: OB-fold nucleic acid binding domain-containing protein [Methylobacteriaceae bacterium]|jgi:DNA-directed RNA polymerase subunit RPC12/RpoP|nr:OB-fold nucleic acid binding domain-containing protein [Methylobacteriaceae bacterium]
MQAFVIVFIFLVIVIILASLSGSGGNTRPPPRSQKTYRPKRSTGGPSIVFSNPAPQNAAALQNATAPQTGKFADAADLSGLVDAFTGVPLDPAKGLYFCSNCKVFYHRESYQLLVEANHSACVACGSKSLIAYQAPRRVETGQPQGRNFDPTVVTLANYQQHVGRVVTFEGRVFDVKVSRRGLDYAVMFEDKSWTKGFKLVFFRGAVAACGGPVFLNSLKGKTIRVRGLIAKDATFGYEIIISERSMILGVQ